MNSVFLVIFLLISIVAISQQASYFDAAQSYNRLLIEKNNGTYTRVSNYKVIGSPYLFGEKHLGSIYAPTENANNILLSYNTFNQELEFYTDENSVKSLIKGPGLVDSFKFKWSIGLGIAQELLFIYGPLMGANDKTYYQLLSKGTGYNLYKKYTGELGIVSANYVQAELRQFDLNHDYYYTITATSAIKKLKISQNALIKEFKSIKNLSGEFDQESLKADPESTLIAIFEALNR